MKMRKSRRRGLKAAGLLCLLLGFSAQNLQAQDTSLWILGMAQFHQVLPEILKETASPEFGFAKAAELAGKSAGGALSATLPSLLFSALKPLPGRLSMKTALQARTADAPFVDARKGKEAFVGLNGLILGFYSFKDEIVECRILFYENESENPQGAFFYKGTISTLENLRAAALPAIMNWVATREVSVVDIATKPSSGAALSFKGTPSEGAIALDGTRIFVYEKGNYPIIVRQSGFEDGFCEITDFKPDSYTSIVIDMKPAAGAALPEASIINAADRLKWADKSSFLKAEKGFSSALGRFVLSLPLSAIAIGTFYSFYEAYSRGAATETALYVSGAAAAVSVSLSLGFIIDSAVRLVDVLHVSR